LKKGGGIKRGILPKKYFQGEKKIGVKGGKEGGRGGISLSGTLFRAAEEKGKDSTWAKKKKAALEEKKGGLQWKRSVVRLKATQLSKEEGKGFNSQGPREKGREPAAGQKAGLVPRGEAAASSKKKSTSEENKKRRTERDEKGGS